MYGSQTRSYLRSTEHRANKKAAAEATAKYLASEKREYVYGPICNCRSFRFPHELEWHRKLRSDKDWRPWEERRTSYEGWESY